ncbi:sugar transferase [Dehalobacterium formicoaceticum]|uniref:Sugar transferase n=1 Tax=Dehalobacterium formicoaceticum TaxID=51515 RepID=A0ABT1Y5N3_9FIRM|nr:sugar transferase [Dehalobacterium formicoaceticum]MCR6545229.1 sugar transferase [Dehalobacterium formicoaceticum]
MYRFNSRSLLNIRQYLMDIIFIVISYMVSYYIAGRFTFLAGFFEYIWILFIFITSWIYTMYARGMYDITIFKYRDRILRNVLFATFVSALNTAAMTFFIKFHTLSRLFFGIFICSTIVLVLFERYLYFDLAKKFGLRRKKKVVFIGHDVITAKYMHFIKMTDMLLHIVKQINLDQEPDYYNLKDEKLMQDLNQLLRSTEINEVIFTVPSPYFADIRKYAKMCEEMGVTTSIALEFSEFKISQISLSSIGTLSKLTFHSVCLDAYQLFYKRCFDLAGGLVGLLGTTFLALFIVPAIKLESRGPVFFTQDRMGMNGRVFKLYKFRSMTVDAEDKKKDLMSQNEMGDEMMFKIKEDPRVTKVGKFLRATSLDELPQFLNVLKGEMSLVGTRPPTLDEVAKYENHHWRRISIKPGITGLWQISGRSQITDFEEIVKLDTKYIDNWSLWLDIKIIYKTVMVVFKKSGAY